MQRKPIGGLLVSYTEDMAKTTNNPQGNMPFGENISVTLCLWFATLCWGGAYVAARFLLAPASPGAVALSPILLATLRFSMASLVFVFPLGRAILRRQIHGRDLLLLALLGQVVFALYYWLQYIGIQQTDASIASILGVGLIPVFTTGLAALVGTERFSVTISIALLLGFLGVALVVFQQPTGFPWQPGFLGGAACLLLNTFFFALYTNLSKHWMRTLSPLLLTSGTMVSSTLGLLVLSLFQPARQWQLVARLTLPQWLAVLFLALGCSVLAYFAYNLALQKRDASRVAFYFYFEPIVSIVLGIILLGEPLTWQIVVGALAIGGSALLVQRLARKREDQNVVKADQKET